VHEEWSCQSGSPTHPQIKGHTILLNLGWVGLFFFLANILGWQMQT